MNMCNWSRSAGSLLAYLLPFLLAAQQTLIRTDGRQWAGQVKGASGGQLKFALDPTSPKTLDVPCSDLLAFITEDVLILQNACEAAARPVVPAARHNCASLVTKDKQVIKGDILVEDMDYFKVRTLRGDQTVTMSDVVVQLNENAELGYTTLESLKEMLGNRSVVAAMNDLGQCPSKGEKVLTQYPGKSAERRVKQRATATATQPRINKSGDLVVPDTTNRGIMKELDFDSLKTIAMDKVQRLKDYITKIVSPDLSSLRKDEAVQLAVNLFASEKNIVQTSTIKPGAQEVKRDWLIGRYFGTVLRNSTKARVTIEWHDEVFASDWELQPDSSYRAIISIQQRYKKEIDGRVVYTDVTNKNIEVILKAHDKFVDGKFEKWWDVFLGDIGVSSTYKG